MPKSHILRRRTERKQEENTLLLLPHINILEIRITNDDSFGLKSCHCKTFGFIACETWVVSSESVFLCTSASDRDGEQIGQWGSCDYWVRCAGRFFLQLLMNYVEVMRSCEENGQICCKRCAQHPCIHPGRGTLISEDIFLFFCLFEVLWLVKGKKKTEHDFAQKY